MKKFANEHKEILQVIATILGVVIIIGGLFIISENTGDRTNDKLGTEPVEEETTNPLLEDGQVIDEEKMKEIEEISYEDFKTYLKKKKTTTVIMLGTDSCYWCVEQKPILQMAMYEYKVDVKYLNVNDLKEDEYSELKELHDDLASFGTPTFISVKNKKVRKVSPNAKTRTQLHSMFVDMGIIEE